MQINLRRNCKCVIPLEAKGVTSALNWGGCTLCKTVLKKGSLGQLQKNMFMFSAGRDKEGMKNVS